MYEVKYRLYCFCHYTAKKNLKRTNLTACKILSSIGVKLGVKEAEGVDYWSYFIESSLIPSGTEHTGTLYAGYIAERKEWCLPSWIWTNAAVVRTFCKICRIEEAMELANKLSSQQQECGGWIVRNDYDKKGAIPMLAPNDSAYIANNAFVELYLATKDEQYLQIAKRCADWIIDTSRQDGMVYVGYNMRDHKWDKNCVIVDVGFTAGLFARLFEITNDERYFNYLRSFTDRFIDLFYIPSSNGFCTSINKDDYQQGGMFGRGQAWALEGLIPAYNVLKDDRIKLVIENTINKLIRVQCANGGWPYNFSHPLMGEDCKGVPVIAKVMMEWYSITSDERIVKCAEKAIKWCRKRTANDGNAKGGIFSFCMEGAIVQNLYTSSAFVYASAYAIELDQMLKQ